MKNIDKMAIVYCRSATKDEKNSADKLKEQQDKCLQKAKEDDYKKVKVITETASGTSLKRRGLQKLIELVKKNKISSVYITEPSRLSRNINDYFTLTDLLRKQNVKVVIANSAINRFTEKMKELFLDTEREMRSARIKTGITNAKKRKLLKLSK